MTEPGNGDARSLSAQLAASEVRLRDIIERSPDAFVFVDRLGVIQFANRAAGALFGASPYVLVGQPFGFPVTNGESTEVDIVRSRGEELVAEMRVLETEWNGKETHIAVLRDVTERTRAERSLKESERRLALAMEAARLGCWDIDLRTNDVTCNDKLFTILGYQRDEVALSRQAWEQLMHPDDVARARQALQEHMAGKTPAYRVECRLRAKSGHWCWVLAQGEVVERGPDGKPLRMIGVTEDIDARKQVEEQIRQVAQRDPLTGLANRALLYEFAERVLSSARRGGRRSAFLFVDLDRFKSINDTYGHDVGDAVLKEAAARLAACVRGEDLVGRLGGDEFVTVLAHVRNAEDAAKAARHALDSLNRPYRTHGLVLHVSPSIGVSVFPQDGRSVDELIKNADTAMYQAKKSGRGNFQFFEEEFNRRLTRTLRIESRLRSGLERRQFMLFYQPVMDTETRSPVGAEALLRWPAVKATPEQFIAVAEAADFMQALGAWVVREACRQQHAWRETGLPAFPVSIKVSASQFQQRDFVRSVGDALEQAGIGGEGLCLEMSEDTVMRNLDETASVLSSLKTLGVELALDGFGTGYSRLIDLGRLPLDILKLDQVFVKAIGRDGAAEAIAEGIIALGRGLGLEVVAEGIESAQALAFLRARQCRRAQGFHFCRPLPAPAFEQWYRMQLPGPAVAPHLHA